MDINEALCGYGTRRDGIFMSIGTATDYWRVSGTAASAISLVMEQDPEATSYLVRDVRQCHTGVIATLVTAPGTNRSHLYFNGDLGLWVFGCFYSGNIYIRMEEEYYP